LRRYGVRPRKKSGQTFLTDPIVAKQIVDAAELSSQDVVLEIGGGLGILTMWLTRSAGHVYVVEIDPRLVRALRDRFENHSNVQVIQGDALSIQLPAANKVVSNLPYSVSSEITFRLIRELEFEIAVLMYQREFADRLLAEPGTRDYSRLTVDVRYAVDVEEVLQVPADRFYPVPAVDSTVVRLKHRTVGPFPQDEDVFYWTVRGVFSYPNKQVRRALRIWFKSFGRNESEADVLLKRCADVITGTERVRQLPVAVFVRLADEVLGMIETGLVPDPRRGGRSR